MPNSSKWGYIEQALAEHEQKKSTRSRLFGNPSRLDDFISAVKEGAAPYYLVDIMLDATRACP